MYGNLQQFTQSSIINLEKRTRTPTSNDVNHSFRPEILDAKLFDSLNKVRELSWAWRITYNKEQPNESIGNVTPAEFKQLVTTKISSHELSV